LIYSYIYLCCLPYITLAVLFVYSVNRNFVFGLVQEHFFCGIFILKMETFLKSGFLALALVIVMLLFVVSVVPVSAAEHQVYEGMTSNSDSNITSTPESIGSGVYFERPFGIAVEADGQLVVTDPVLDAVVRVDPVSGNRSILSDNSTGSGTCFKEPRGIAVEVDRSLIVVAEDMAAVVRIDPVSGNRSIVSDNSTGSGPGFKTPRDIAVEADGSLVVTDRRLDEAVVRVDPVNGNRTIVSEACAESGPVFKEPRGIAVESNGSLVVADRGLRAVVRVDPVSGNRTIVSGGSTGPWTGL
jgi:streptogramin lyase